MSKITFRADDELIDELERFDASKSEVMRDALRTYLEEAETSSTRGDAAQESIDDVLRDRIDELVTERLHRERQSSQGLNITVDLEGRCCKTSTPRESEPTRSEPRVRETGTDSTTTQCGQCGEAISEDHVYCPNCGEKASHRLFCECGDELRSDWSFCPGCGRRTPAADVLDSSGRRTRES